MTFLSSRVMGASARPAITSAVEAVAMLSPSCGADSLVTVADDPLTGQVKTLSGSSLGATTLTPQVTSNPAGTPNTPADSGWMANQSSWPGSSPTAAPTAGTFISMYTSAHPTPAAMPATAPRRVAPRQKMPSSIAGTKADAASENE